MKPSELAFRIRVALTTATFMALAYFWYSQTATPLRMPTPPTYSAFEVALHGEWIAIRNAGDEVLTSCEIEFGAGLDSPGGATYRGRRYYPRWSPGEAQEIGISTSYSPMDVLSVRFTGSASSPEKGAGYWRLEFPVSKIGG
ncbi:hypothetical protein [Limnoglobus roseus]|uniref:Uncharacterized protein n=1 Tax=Limnoglobus roseus TaxID=2598579 RepID=A0A5C1AQB9_9BACT|nr:hypothetical protein [Limnoglobus roseus]QEL19952.1 hypothetical protein PX52LOC_07035 [Limnoglobus roseus]